MNKIYAIILMVIFPILLAGCQNKKVYRIGVSQCSEDDWRRKMNDEIEREVMFHNDVAVVIRSADDRMKLMR